MNIKNAAKLFLGSAFIYIAMASCVASERATMGSAATTGTNGAGGHGGSMMAGNGGIGGIFDPVPDAGAETSSSGSRLKARRYIAEDGARSEVTGFWYDSVRNEDCAFTSDEIGQTRCIPFQTVAYAYYEDGQCTQPIASPTHNAACQSTKKYVGIYDVSQCTKNGPRIHEFGTPVVPSLVWFLKPDNTCVTIGGIESTVIDWHRLGPHISPTEFVAATLTVDP
jgi:hypothetical protein